MGRREKGQGPRRFGKYDVLDKIAVGGMGVVYRARHRRLGRIVALKMIRSPGPSDQRQVQRFHTEAQAVARLDHPNIVPLYDFGQRRGRHFYSMRLVEGGSLATHLPRLKEDPRKCAGIVATVARAVHHAHVNGVYHRDLKPSNILLDADDHPYVSDFGLAKQVDEATMTQTGTVLGTASYMAPEQAAGKQGKGTPAAVVYGLGAVLYELLTGQPPFTGDTDLAVLRKVQEQPPRPPRSINRKVHPDLETICLKCLEKDPRKRYSSAETVALDLERFLKQEPVRAKRAPQRGSAAGWVRRRAALIASVAAGLVVFIAAAAAFILQARVPVVFLMDTPEKHGVYDEDVYASNGTNATVLREVLADLLPSGSFFKETLDAKWNSEAHLIARRPNLILIHRSAFFHTRNAQPGFGFNYPPKPGNGKVADWEDETGWRALYAVEDDKLMMFLGHIGNASPKTRFLIYSRGTGGGWERPQDRRQWVDRLVQRFPWLEGRIDTMFIPEIEGTATFRNKATRDEVRQHVKGILGL